AQEDTRGMLDARRVAMVDQVLGGWSRRIGLVLTHCLVEGEAGRVRAKGGKVCTSTARLRNMCRCVVVTRLCRWMTAYRRT
ncbi:hypothetical protein, partial [Pseudomonas viridiflava]|uniref:hypothetical protein n=1 Tax=Pseudomonas viridiflava TaxID=33069 RepID=UPI00197F345C